MKFLLTEKYWLDLLDKLGEWLTSELPFIVLIIVIFFVSMKFFNKLAKKLHPILLKRKYIEKSRNPQEAQKRIKTLINITQNAIRISLWVVFILVLLSRLGIDIAPLLASAGIIGLAVGFGSQELVKDVIAGFFMLLENQVRVGDTVIINNTVGTVEKIELRTITLRDLHGTVHIFQNGKVNTLSNTTKDWSAAVFEIGIAYKEDVSSTITIMLQVFEEMKSCEQFGKIIIAEMEIMGLDRFDASAVVIKARIKTEPGEQWALKREYQNRLKTAFDNAGIEIPFPHTTLYWGEKTPPLKIEMNEKK